MPLAVIFLLLVCWSRSLASSCEPFVPAAPASALAETAGEVVLWLTCSNISKEGRWTLNATEAQEVTVVKIVLQGLSFDASSSSSGGAFVSFESLNQQLSSLRNLSLHITNCTFEHFGDGSLLDVRGFQQLLYVSCVLSEVHFVHSALTNRAVFVFNVSNNVTTLLVVTVGLYSSSFAVASTDGMTLLIGIYALRDVVEFSVKQRVLANVLLDSCNVTLTASMTQRHELEPSSLVVSIRHVRINSVVQSNIIIQHSNITLSSNEASCVVHVYNATLEASQVRILHTHVLLKVVDRLVGPRQVHRQAALIAFIVANASDVRIEVDNCHSTSYAATDGASAFGINAIQSVIVGAVMLADSVSVAVVVSHSTFVSDLSSVATNAIPARLALLPIIAIVSFHPSAVVVSNVSITVAASVLNVSLVARTNAPLVASIGACQVDAPSNHLSVLIRDCDILRYVDIVVVGQIHFFAVLSGVVLVVDKLQYPGLVLHNSPISATAQWAAGLTVHIHNSSVTSVTSQRRERDAPCSANSSADALVVLSGNLEQANIAVVASGRREPNVQSSCRSPLWAAVGLFGAPFLLTGHINVSECSSIAALLRRLPTARRCSQQDCDATATFMTLTAGTILSASLNVHRCWDTTSRDVVVRSASPVVDHILLQLPVPGSRSIVLQFVHNTFLQPTNGDSSCFSAAGLFNTSQLERSWHLGNPQAGLSQRLLFLECNREGIETNNATSVQFVSPYFRDSLDNVPVGILNGFNVSQLCRNYLPEPQSLTPAVYIPEPAIEVSRSVVAILTSVGGASSASLSAFQIFAVVLPRCATRQQSAASLFLMSPFYSLGESAIVLGNIALVVLPVAVVSVVAIHTRQSSSLVRDRPRTQKPLRWFASQLLADDAFVVKTLRWPSLVMRLAFALSPGVGGSSIAIMASAELTVLGVALGSFGLLWIVAVAAACGSVFSLHLCRSKRLFFRRLPQHSFTNHLSTAKPTAMKMHLSHASEFVCRLLYPCGAFHPTNAAHPFRVLLCQASSVVYVPLLHFPHAAAVLVVCTLRVPAIQRNTVPCVVLWSIVGVAQLVFAAVVAFKRPHQCGIQSVVVSFTAAMVGVAATANAVVSSTSRDDDESFRTVVTITSYVTAVVSLCGVLHGVWLAVSTRQPVPLQEIRSESQCSSQTGRRAAAAPSSVISREDISADESRVVSSALLCPQPALVASQLTELISLICKAQRCGCHPNRQK